MSPIDAVEALLERAIECRASDIHLDPVGTGLGIRLRVDGRFIELDPVGPEEGRRLVGRLKVLAGLMVYRCDIPQEGRLELPGGREGRLAVIPTPYGEKATLRLFDPERAHVKIGDLGFAGQILDWLRSMLRLDRGLVLVVGPSGSGKTTTLYAMVSEIVALRGEFCHVTSIEDPIERRIAGCTQVQVDPGRNLDFATGLKFLLRQDPEVVMVGEIRDAETATVAVRAAMTGHLVLSSLHCGRANEARPRLLEMGVERYAVDLALAGVVAQRLLRRCCASCDGSGCAECFQSGYRGRAVIAEALSTGRQRPQTDLRASGEDLARQGITTPEEVARVLGGLP